MGVFTLFELCCTKLRKASYILINYRRFDCYYKSGQRLLKIRAADKWADLLQIRATITIRCTAVGSKNGLDVATVNLQGSNQVDPVQYSAFNNIRIGEGAKSPPLLVFPL